MSRLKIDLKRESTEAELAENTELSRQQDNCALLEGIRQEVAKHERLSLAPEPSNSNYGTKSSKPRYTAAQDVGARCHSVMGDLDAVVLMTLTQGRMSILNYVCLSDALVVSRDQSSSFKSGWSIGIMLREFAAIKFAISSSFPQAFIGQASGAILEAAIHFNGRHSKPVQQVITSPLLWHTATCALITFESDAQSSLSMVVLE